jgi:hypothetical protein
MATASHNKEVVRHPLELVLPPSHMIDAVSCTNMMQKYINTQQVQSQQPLSSNAIGMGAIIVAVSPPPPFFMFMRQWAFTT